MHLNHIRVIYGNELFGKDMRKYRDVGT